MTASDNRGGDPSDLRRRAETRLRLTREDIEAMSSHDVQELVYELQVHQIELDMQNEALSQAQAETEAARQRYQDLYDHAPAGYLTLGADDVVVEANLMAGRLLEIDRDRLVGRAFTDFVAPGSRAVYALHRAAVRRTHERQDCQLEVVPARTGDAEPVHLYVSSHAEVGNDRCRTVLSDVTVMKKLEARLVAMAEDAQAASRAKSQFLATMSHEVRTPLNAIVGLTDLIDPAGLPEDQKDYLATIAASARTLRTLMNDLLDLSRLESGALQLEIRPFDLWHLLIGVQRMCAVEANAKGVHVAVEFEKALPHVYRGDGFRLRQIVQNLVANAVKFTARGLVRINVTGQPAMEERQFELSIRVIDTGIGVPQDKREAIFDSFVQADGSMTRRFGGAGLGLAIARSLARSMGGDISVGDNDGGGAVFALTLQLPAAAFPAGADQRDDVADTEAFRPRVLLVEDEPLNVMVATAYLERFGCETMTCARRDDVADLVRRQDFDLVLLDIDGPRHEGLAVARTVRDAVAASEVPVPVIMAMTADAWPRGQDLSEAGLDGLLGKPLDPVALQTCVVGLARARPVSRA